MALQTNDIGVFFASMRAVYGHLWAQTADDVPAWQRALSRFTPLDLQTAANSCVKEFPGRPPSMGQVIGLIESRKPRGQKWIAPQQFSLVLAQANRIMFASLIRAGSVRKDTLKAMIDAKNMLAEGAEKEQQDEIEFATELDTVLRGIVRDRERVAT